MVGDGETTFIDAAFGIGGNFSLGELNYLGIYKNCDGSVFDGADEKDAQRDSDLGGGQSHTLGTFGCQKSLFHIFEYS